MEMLAFAFTPGLPALRAQDTFGGENHEGKRLVETQQQKMPLRRWGPFLSERQWGTVREDNSDNGDAWDYFSHAAARSHTYRWGEDGIAGISDDMQRVCFALALWDGEDDFLKERMFGITNSQGNHGEDVKEYYFYSTRLFALEYPQPFLKMEISRL